MKNILAYVERLQTLHDTGSLSHSEMSAWLSQLRREVVAEMDAQKPSEELYAADLPEWTRVYMAAQD